MTFSQLDLINLLACLTELRETFTSVFQLYMESNAKGHRGTSRWKRCARQVCGKGSTPSPAVPLSEHLHVPTRTEALLTPYLGELMEASSWKHHLMRMGGGGWGWIPSLDVLVTNHTQGPSKSPFKVASLEKNIYTSNDLGKSQGCHWPTYVFFIISQLPRLV